MRVLLLGSGAREHALALGLYADPAVNSLTIAPGNAGMADLGELVAEVENQPVDITDGAMMVSLARAVNADLVVIGPEQPLVAGVADDLRAAGFAVFGPSKAAAMLEGSKLFAKQVMEEAGVLTAEVTRVTPADSAATLDAALDAMGPTWVVKDDGLAGGKGVVVTADRNDAAAHAQAVLQAGHDVLFESFLDGPEISLFCLVDGETVVPLLPAQDHKRAYDNDEGPNTGGMGAYTPLPWVSAAAVEHIVQTVVEPVAAAMVRRGTPYSGLLYAGLAWGKRGPAVVEFNCRFGDPETQAVLSLLKSPLGEVLHATATGKLASLPPLQWKDGAACIVVLAAEGYPAKPRTGDAIVIEEHPGDAAILHAGTRVDEQGTLCSAGGRVLGIVGHGADLTAARKQAYDTLGHISLPGSFYRRDIGATTIDPVVIPET
ncbi:phosphoribosylamine--glycine ligase [Corynebacterium choanae]|uniref:Phosphoribosylamine--glycine ligase n=1 Tax=Corynebacterium choanae TaxID=1862358 RepID=A0A3G6J452_9CORY|nr:phosphoribosylamine--glycine ligase [Corynebacterium choanae]AZA12797.1 Phosphoribosylamine--glycine ligase [Corynebacterium choanae]